MTQIHATWEKANIGVDTIEIKCEEADSAAELREALEQCKDFKGLISVTVSAGNTVHLTKELEQYGFNFAECLLDCGFRLKKDHRALMEKMYARMPKYEYRVIESSDDCQKICNEIRKGIFTEERFSKDENFGIEKANNRMANWLYSFFENKEMLLVELYSPNTQTALGFGAYYRENDNMMGLLKGMYLGVTDMMAASAIDLHSFLKIYEMQGIRRFKTSYSSNNLKAVHMAQAMGIEVQGMRYVFMRYQA